MYSVVLMAALTTGANTPDCWWLRGGCWGSSYSCNGCYGSSTGCHGCWGGYRAGCWGSRSCYGCYGSCHGCYGSSTSCHGCYGSCHGCYGSCHGCTGGAAAPAQKQKEPPKATKPDAKKSASINSAKMIVELPADAALYVDDQLMKASSNRRVFSTPELEDGQAYYYILRAEYERGGVMKSETKRVIVRAGDTVRAAFDMVDTTTTARAEIGE